MRDKVAIIGYGYVGRAMAKIFPDALIHDPFLKDLNIKVSSQEEVNSQAKLAVVCVPTPMNKDGSCDLSAVESTLEWLKVPLILIKSTVPPGTTGKFREKYPNKKICFSPEYIGEGKYFVAPWRYPDPKDPTKHDFMIIGGPIEDAEEIQAIFQRRLGPDKFYYLIPAKEAEMVKYMENCWGAMKVTFCNEFYEICKAFGVSYPRIREGFLLDSRTERMHTAVFPDARGFGGKCYPKDLNALIKASLEVGYDPKLLREVWESNKRFRGEDEV